MGSQAALLYGQLKKPFPIYPGACKPCLAWNVCVKISFTVVLLVFVVNVVCQKGSDQLLF